MPKKELAPPPRLDAWNALIEEVSLPSDFALALMSGRGELTKIVNRPLSAEEAKQVAHALGVLIDTNRALQVHAAELAELVEQLQGNIKGIGTKLYQLADHANFRSTSEDYEDE